jgi:hypothetical protein
VLSSRLHLKRSITLHVPTLHQDFNQSDVYFSNTDIIKIPQPVKIRLYVELTNSVAPEPEGSSPHSQQPANGPYPEPGESTPHPPQPISPRSILIPSSHLRLGLSSGLLPSGFPTKTLYRGLLIYFVRSIEIRMKTRKIWGGGNIYL